MRILVLSNVLGSVDKVVDVLHERHNVVAKEANMAESTMANTAADQLGSRAYDEVILIARDPIQAGMLLNKKEGVDAAVCGSVEDVNLAKSNGANAIVIRDIDSESVAEIVAQTAGISLRGLKVQQTRAPQQAPQSMPSQAGAQPKEEPPAPRAPLFHMPSFKMPQMLPKQQASKRMTLGQRKARQPAPAEEPVRQRTSRPGSIKDKIKDYLGIM